MGLKPDSWIREMAIKKGMIDPFYDGQMRNGVISYGLSSYGYDIRIANEFKVFAAMGGQEAIVDPKNLEERMLIDYRGDVCVIPPNSFALARSLEHLNIPEDVLATVLGKSTYARVGVVTNFTPLEPGWRGHITIEISNTTPLPVKIYANEGIAQVLFFQGDSPCEVSYADRKGKYQDQAGVTLPRL